MSNSTEAMKEFVNTIIDIKSLLHIYAAVKSVRDEGTEVLNRGISNVVVREQMKKSWSYLNKFCKAYEKLIETLRKEE